MQQVLGHVCLLHVPHALRRWGTQPTKKFNQPVSRLIQILLGDILEARNKTTDLQIHVDDLKFSMTDSNNRVSDFIDNKSAVLIKMLRV